MVFKASRHQKLQENPLILQEGDKEIQVEPVKPEDRPKISRTLHSIIDLMNEPDDFRKIPEVLKGLNQASRPANAEIATKITRKANEMGLQDVTMRCARGVKNTGFNLGNVEVADEAILGAHLMAQQSEWTKEGLEAASKYAWNITRLLDEPRHSGKNQKIRKPVPHGTLNLNPSAQPHFIGILLELSALQAVKYNDRNDMEGRVGNFADKFLATWENKEEAWPNHPNDTHRCNHVLAQWAPTWFGLKAAVQVRDLDASQKKGLKEHLAELTEALTDAKQTLLEHDKKANDRRGVKLFDELLKQEV
jgi:hypothetical protein